MKFNYRLIKQDKRKKVAFLKKTKVFQTINQLKKRNQEKDFFDAQLLLESVVNPH